MISNKLNILINVKSIWLMFGCSHTDLKGWSICSCSIKKYEADTKY